ncbi:YihY/virulence factor BrkB family protein [Calidifontibacter sp. DB0510]|uniref:YihY/virulence factor BrkB family protein n=1 Tax=Metallococcus carri TaxID=1656884 RepID=A0A967B448_9MICO|nr:YihY/virulence factor BrkB family protein [Metallococcus carri]NOP37680.1 YihY/virulence factor BrkB family protein [Calidifontibacter sp. DB2511S]
MKPWLKQVLSRVPGAVALARLIVTTVRICLQYRVTGLAAEAGFFALLSFPPLVFGLLGGVGYLGGWLGPNTVNRVTEAIENYAAKFLTEESLREVLLPTITDALHGGRPDVISIGFVLSLWSGSRALNVLLDTISIMYGQGGKRGIVRTRVLSLSLYIMSLLFGAIVLPLIVIGPQLLSEWLPGGLQALMLLYWPLVGGLTILGMATLFYIATPVRTPWVRDLPGAVLTLAVWVLSSMVLRWVLGNSVGGTSIYGPLAATIVVLIWLYFIGIAVLIGASLNAAVNRLWPMDQKIPVRERAKDLLVSGVQLTRRRGREDDEPAGVAEEDDEPLEDDDPSRSDDPPDHLAARRDTPDPSIGVA